MTIAVPAELASSCQDCQTTEGVMIIAADLGLGAFLAVLCETCWHRRQYRAELEKRRTPR